MTTHPTGSQWTLCHGAWEATVVEVGGGLRSLTYEGVDVVAGYPAGDLPSAGRGQLLMPWPNRIRDGRYTIGGATFELPITEHATGSASQGLVRWAPFRLATQADDRVALHHVVHAQPGWPHTLAVEVVWALDDTGLTCTSTVELLGGGPAPFGYGAHPYLALGSTPAADARVTVPADRVLLVDERKLPTELVPVTGTPFDLRDGDALGERSIDHACTGLRRDADGRWRVTVEAEGRRLAVWGGAGLDWVQVFTGKARPEGLPPGHPPGIAVEPLSCPADAFTSGDSLVLLEVGDTWSAQWGIEAG